jgi:peptidoglycan hydrolase CwlO-like protein
MAAVTLVVTSVGATSISGRVQVSTAEHDDLHDRVDAARAGIPEIQEKADSVEKQIASIDEQAAAVAGALEASRELVASTQAKIAVLEDDIARKKRTYRRLYLQRPDFGSSGCKTSPRLST